MAYFGLTGGIASGKSTAARMFEELGARIIDADQLGHELMRASLPAYQEVVRHFGGHVLDPSGEIDRQRLGAVVFSDAGKLEELNRILHPRIIERTEQLANEYAFAEPYRLILVDAALIFEAGIGGRFRQVIVAWCRPEQQLDRLMAKAGISPEEARRRIAAQMTVEEKRRRADAVIDTSGSLENTRAQVKSLYAALQRVINKEREELRT